VKAKNKNGVPDRFPIKRKHSNRITVRDSKTICFLKTPFVERNKLTLHNVNNNNNPKNALETEDKLNATATTFLLISLGA
jgi:hypothetical protein